MLPLRQCIYYPLSPAFQSNPRPQHTPDVPFEPACYKVDQAKDELVEPIAA